MKLHLAPIPDSLLAHSHTDEIRFIRELMSGLLGQPRVEIQQTTLPDRSIIGFSNKGPTMSDLPTNIIWTNHARQLYPAEKDTKREVRLLGSPLYNGQDMYEYGLTHGGYEFGYNIAPTDKVQLVTHWSVGWSEISKMEISTFSVTVTTKGPISRACFKVEIDPESLS